MQQGTRLDDALRASRRAVELATRFALPDRASFARNLSELERKLEAGMESSAD